MPGRDIFADLDSWESEQDPDDGSDPEVPATTPADDGVLGTGLTLEELAAGSGKYADIFKELLAIRAEREARVEQERLALEGEAALDAGNVDLDTPEAQAALGALAEKRQRQALVVQVREYRAALAKQNWAEEVIEQKVAEMLAVQQAEVDEWFAPAAPKQVPEYLEWSLQREQQARAKQTVMDMQVRYAQGYEADEAAARTFIQAEIERVLAS